VKPLIARLPESVTSALSNLPWLEIGLTAASAILMLALYLPRRSRYGVDSQAR
jgi:hypothetical protein